MAALRIGGGDAVCDGLAVLLIPEMDGDGGGLNHCLVLEADVIWVRTLLSHVDIVFTLADQLVVLRDIAAIRRDGVLSGLQRALLRGKLLAVLDVADGDGGGLDDRLRGRWHLLA